MLSASAFNAFLKTLEEPPAHAIFILATTEKHKILPTILSRCQTYDFNRISVEDMARNLEEISAKEGVTAERDALHIIGQKADGSMRDALTLFDQTVAFCGTNITYSQVISTLNVLDYDYYFRLTDHFLNNRHSEALLIFDEILSKGFNALHFIGGLSAHFRDLLVSKEKSTIKLLELPPSLLDRYSAQAAICSLSFLYEALNITTQCEAGYKSSGHQRLHIEFALCSLSRITSAPTKVKEMSVTAKQTQTPKTSQETPPSKENTTGRVPEPVVPEPVVPERNEADQKPIPAQSSRPATTSLKELLKSAEQKINSTAKSTVNETGEESFDEEKLQNVWIKMADAESSLPNLATSIRQVKPVIKGENTILFVVSNKMQKDWIEKKCMFRLTAFLRKNLNNKHVTMEVDIIAEDKAEKKLYMPDEKAKFLLENSEELRELKKDLRLEIK